MTERIVVAPLGNADCPAGEPFLRVVRGNPTPDEIAALVIVFLSHDTEAGTRHARRRRSAWADPAHLLRHPWYRRYRLRPAPGRNSVSSLPAGREPSAVPPADLPGVAAGVM